MSSMSDMIYKFSAGGVVWRDGKVLTIKWLSQDTIEFPKGTIEFGETEPKAAIREVYEETGYRADIVADLDTVAFEYDWQDGRRYRKTVHYYLMALSAHANSTPQREENEDFENLWLTPEEARILLSHEDSRTVLQRVIDIQDKIK